jgi:hypothetical protein
MAIHCFSPILQSPPTTAPRVRWLAPPSNGRQPPAPYAEGPGSGWGCRTSDWIGDLGAGGFASVSKARHRRTGAVFALNMSFHADPDIEEEAKVLSRAAVCSAGPPRSRSSSWTPACSAVSSAAAGVEGSRSRRSSRRCVVARGLP